MKKYEYFVRSFPTEDVDSFLLFNFGKDGWEFISVVDDVKKYGMLKLFFRREIK